VSELDRILRLMAAVTYDANDNLATGGGWTYTHNANSRLVGVSGPEIARFGRDGRNRHVKSRINGTTYLIYDGWNLVVEHDAAYDADRPIHPRTAGG